MKNELEKDTNPKDALGVAKAPMSTIPAGVLMEIGLAMFEGGRKYGRHNYRDAGIRASVYYDATFRHLFDFWEGEDLDQDSGLSHVTKALASLVVLRDAMINDKWTDDRPPKLPEGWLKRCNKVAKGILEKYPESKAAHTELTSASSLDEHK
jgi:hypothetical protein|tara:strand:- start:2315 stop:2770 length:456 start_codon:yes stop_codon:yes gene_type:complete